jgi:hypothetical protein
VIRRRPICVVAVSLALPLVTSARAFAADTPEETSPSGTSVAESGLHYEAPRDCPAVDAYLTQVEQRLGPNWESALEQLAPRVNIEITLVAARYRGALEFVTERGERISRTVSGAVCAEVVDSIALMTALAVQARIVEPAEPPEKRESPNQPLSTAPAAKLRSPAATDLVARSRTVAAASSTGSKLHVRLGGRASITSGVGPEIALGPGAFAVLELGKARLGLAADLFNSAEVQARIARADFRLASARLDACPWSFELGGSATLEPCAAGELGSLRVAPHPNPPAVTVAEPKAVTWGALDLLGRLVFRLRPFVIVVELVGRLPLRHERFYVGSREQIVFQIPTISAGASAGLGLQF